MTRRELLAVAPSAVAAAGTPSAGFVRIDSHVHIHRDAPPFVAAMEAARWQAVTICVSEATAAADASHLDDQLRATAALARSSRGCLAWAATLDARGFESPDFSERTVASLQRCFREGAIGVKVWKNVGLGILAKSGAFLMPDNAALMPAYEAIQRADRTLFVHLAGTGGGWMPINPRNPEYAYYKVHPEWNLYGRAGAPTKAQIMAARNRVLERFPKLRVIGCHVGSNEDDLAAAAKHFDAYPNLAVDTAAKVRYLAHGNRDQVREFLLRYQDRVLYATDFTLPAQNEARSWHSLQATYDRDWQLFAGSEAMEYAGRKVQGLALPEPVLRKIFRDNARHWVRL